MPHAFQRKLKSVLFALIILVTSSAAVIGLAKAARAAITNCQNYGYYIVYARGATAKLGEPSAYALKGHLQYLLPNAAWAELGNLDKSRDDNQDPDSTSEYPASPVGGPWYGDSVETGTQELINHLNYRYTPAAQGGMGCGTETAIIAGYSEGADVVGWAMEWDGYGGLSQTAKNRIGYVALYGDPKFDRRCSSARWWVQGNIKQCGGNGILGPREPYARDYLKYRLGSWCDFNDGYCNGSPNQGTHGTAYKDYWFQQSATEVVGWAVLKRNSLFPGSTADPLPPRWSPEADFGVQLPTPPPAVKHVKRTAGPDGVREVYASTSSAVTEAWWYPGGDGVHTNELINIGQNNIVDFDKVNEPDGVTQSLYTAVPDGIWESWWRPGEGIHHNKIVTGLNGVHQVIADPAWENGQYTHRLYILAQDGPYEAWWRDGGDGMHVSRLDTISNPVTIEKARGPDGTDQLYVATPTWVFELWWRPDTGVHRSTVITITQGDIRSLDKGDNLPGRGQLLYTGTSTTAWQSYWANSAPSHGTIAHGQNNAIQIKKTIYGGVHQLYLATDKHVQEYWWNGPDSGTSELIRIPQGTITAFDKSADGSDQQLYTAAGDLVYETWWRGGSNASGPNTNVLFKVAR